MKILFVVSADVDQKEFEEMGHNMIGEIVRRDIKRQIGDLGYTRRVEVVYLPREFEG